MAKPGYVWSGTEWELITGPSQGRMPAGTIAMWVTSTPPTGWLMCDGSQYSIATYGILYANIGTTYELGTEAVGYSRLPNMQDRFVIGAVSKDKVAQQDAYQSNSLSTQQHTFVSDISVATGNTAHNHNLAAFNNDHAHNTNTPTTNGDGAHNHPMNAHNPNASNESISRTAGGASATFVGHSHNANAPSTNGGGGHNHSLNAVSTNTANTVSHAHSTNFSTLNTHNHTVTNVPVQSAAPTTTVIPSYRAIHYIIKAVND